MIPLAVSISATAVATVVLAFVLAPSGRLPPVLEITVGIALGLIVFCEVGLVVAWQFRSRIAARAVDGPLATVMLALTLWFPLLLVPVYFVGRAVEPSTEIWLEYAFYDKRWVTTLFVVGALGPMVAIAVAGALLAAATARTADAATMAETGSVSDVRAGSIEKLPRPTPGWLSPGAKILFAVAAAYYFFGPPWSLWAIRSGIDYHEEGHLGALQAVREGAVPYIRGATLQYGPGTQTAMYAYMRTIGTFSVVGSREAFALFHWIGATLFLSVVFIRLSFGRAILAGLLAILVFPTFQLFRFAPGATFEGFFGWGNTLRYGGVFAVALLFTAALECQQRRRRLVAGFGIGLLWGLTTYLAQENLIAGLLALLALSVLLIASRTYRFAGVVKVLGAVALGWAAVWTPIIAYYVHESVLPSFVHWYFFDPLAIAGGWQDTSYLEGWHSPWGRMYYVLPFALAALAIASVVQVHPVRFARAWTRERTLLVSLLVVAIVCDQASMLRADQSHLVATMLAIPVLFVVAATSLPDIIGIRRFGAKAAIAAVIAVSALALLPSSAYTPHNLREGLTAPYTDRITLARATRPPSPTSGAAARVGAGLAVAPVCCTGSTWTMPRFIRLMNELKKLIGNRVTYVQAFEDGFPGLLYFVGDLRPAPVLADPYTMVPTQRLRMAWLQDFARHIHEVKAEIVTDTTSQDAAVFKRTYSQSRTITLRYRNKPLYVLLDH